MAVERLVSRPLRDVFKCVGEHLGPTDWLTLDADQLKKFVDATNPDQENVDLTISHNNEHGDSLVDGTLLLSLLPHCLWRLWPFCDEGTWALNYGYDRVRFLTPVFVGDRVRAIMRIADVQERGPGRVLVKMANTLELEGRDTPAMVADALMLYLDASPENAP